MNNGSEFSISVLRSRLATARDSGEPIVLSSSDVVKALNAFVAGEITKQELADWAEFHDANDDVEFVASEAIASIVFEMSSPEINGWLDEARAKKLLFRLLERPAP